MTWRLIYNFSLANNHQKAANKERERERKRERERLQDVNECFHHTAILQDWKVILINSSFVRKHELNFQRAYQTHTQTFYTLDEPLHARQTKTNVNGNQNMKYWNHQTVTLAVAKASHEHQSALTDQLLLPKASKTHQDTKKIVPKHLYYGYHEKK